jgi:AcrR family transcriptional regulator
MFNNLREIDPMTQYPKHMKMSELSACAKIPAATIRYYSRLGLMPDPIKSGKTMAYYTTEHLERLQHIHSLKEKGLTLAAISEVVEKPGEPVHAGSNIDSMFTSKRDVIVRAAIDLFRQRGYDAITINDIVEGSGTGKGTFYQYFKNKEALFFECADRVFEDIGKDDPAIRDEPDGMKRLWNRAHSFIHAHLYMIDMLNLARGASTKGGTRSRRMLDKVIYNLVDPITTDLLIASKQGKIHFEDYKVLAHLLMGVTEYAYYYYQNHPESDIESVLMKCWDMIFNGL